MKKIFLIVAVLATLCLTGCGSLNEKDIRKNFINDIESLKAYHMEGKLELTNNDDTYEYDVVASYQKDDNYKVSLVNKANNYEQIILKNADGVYVITPSLNKSFKFQSDWPNNNSQSYLLDSVAKDLKNDEDYTFTQKDKDYVFTVKANYPNNPKYVKQNIILDKDFNLKGVEVQSEEGVTFVKFEVTSLDKKANFDDKTFNLEEITKDFVNTETKDQNKDQTKDSKQTETAENNTNTNTNENESSTTETSERDNKNSTEPQTEENTSNETNTSNKANTTSKVDENVFPLYLPSNTSLSDKEVISTDSGERVIMTFSGDNPFILVQETVKPSTELEIIPTYGEPFMLIDTVGSLTDTSYTWTSNGVEYYIVSDQMNKNELLEVAKSINIVSTINEK